MAKRPKDFDERWATAAEVSAGLREIADNISAVGFAGHVYVKCDVKLRFWHEDKSEPGMSSSIMFGPSRGSERP